MQGVVIHPHDGGFKLVRHFWRIVRSGDYIPARTVDFIRKAYRNGLPRNSFVQLTIERHDLGNSRSFSRWQHANGVARFDRSRRDQARKTTEIEIGTVHPLNRKAERLALVVSVVELNSFEMLHQGFTAIPRRVGGTIGHVVACEPRYGDAGDVVGYSRFANEGVEIIANSVVTRLIITDQVHFVHRQHDVLYADQMREIGMAARLYDDPFARIDQQDREICGGCACHHVAGILFVARAVGDNEFALFSSEKTVGNVDSDTLFAFSGKAVDEQGKVYLLPLRAHTFAVGLERFQLIFEDHLGIIKQPSDQGGLAVIDAAAGNEPQ